MSESPEAKASPGLPDRRSSHEGEGWSGPPLSAADFLERLRSGDRQALARAVTLVESRRHDHIRLALELIEKCLPHAGGSTRVGISGLPGAGKSTLIDRLGVQLADKGHRVAVLAVDPSSGKTGGSILGDKTRMETLSRHPSAFVRSSPTSGSLGGIGPSTREAVILCEAAGYDVVIVETVGVGQSEFEVSQLVDFLVLLVMTGGGDELQGIKRGVSEFADLVVVTKADGHNRVAAEGVARLYRQIVPLFAAADSGWQPEVLTVSALAGDGIEELWSIVDDYRSRMVKSGYWQQRRRDQSVYWMHTAIDEAIRNAFHSRPGIQQEIERLERQVRTGEVSPSTAAAKLIGYSQKQD